MGWNFKGEGPGGHFGTQKRAVPRWLSRGWLPGRAVPLLGAPGAGPEGTEGRGKARRSSGTWFQPHLGRLFPESKPYCFLSRKEEGRKLGSGRWTGRGDLLSLSPGSPAQDPSSSAGGLWKPGTEELVAKPLTFLLQTT